MSLPIRVLHVLGKLNRNGAETMIMNIYREVDRNKIQFDFVIHTTEKCDYDDEIISMGGIIHRITRYNGLNHFEYRNQWKEILSVNNYKLIHGHVRSTASIYIPIAKKYGIKTISHSHSISSGKGILGGIKKVLQYPVRYQADFFMACSDEAATWMFGKKVLKHKNYYKINNAIHLKKFMFNPYVRTVMRTKMNLEGKYVIGHVGRFEKEKNHSKLIHIFNEFHKTEPNSVLLLLGEGSHFFSVKKIVKNLNLENVVLFAGNQSNVNDYYQCMDLFLFPSLYEGLGMVVIEAQTSGLECIVSENIPKEAYITSSIHTQKNSNQNKLWIEKISSLRKENSSRKVDNYTLVKAAGYDIKETSLFLTNFYEKNC